MRDTYCSFARAFAIHSPRVIPSKDNIIQTSRTQRGPIVFAHNTDNNPPETTYDLSTDNANDLIDQHRIVCNCKNYPCDILAINQFFIKHIFIVRNIRK